MRRSQMHAAASQTGFPGGSTSAETFHTRSRSVLTERPPALLFRNEGDNCAETLFEIVRRVARFEEPPFLTDGRLFPADDRFNPPLHQRLFLRFTHPLGATTLAAFADSFDEFFATPASFFEAGPVVPDFELSAVFPQRCDDLARFFALVQQCPATFTEFALSTGFRFDRHDEPDALTAEGFTEAHFRLATGGASPAECFAALLAQADPNWRLTFRRFGEMSSHGPLRPDLTF